MSHELELPDEVYDAVVREADAQGLTPAVVIANAFMKPGAVSNGSLASDMKESQGTLFDRLKGMIGVIEGRSGTEDYAARSSEIFADDLVKAHDQRP